LKTVSRYSMSVRRTLLMVLFPGLMLVVAGELWLSWRTAHDAANAAFDRSLLGAIKSLDSNITTASGGLGVELPYRMLEFFELTANGRVYYRVSTEDGLVDIGSTDLPTATSHLVTGQPQFSDAVYYAEPVRVGSYARVLDPPLAGSAGPQRVVIQIAETLESRQSFTQALVLQSLARDVLLTAVATVLLVLAVGWALRPLARLRREVLSRGERDLTPISAGGIPADVGPLVEAINFHIARNRQQTESHRRFVDDASHQLRTPMATLATQVGFAMREKDPVEKDKALAAIKLQLDETVRQTNQMLSLARTDSTEIAPEPVNLSDLAQKVTRQWWSEARAKGVDLGLEPGDERVVVMAQPAILSEALVNLLHNAIRYTPKGGMVTVQLAKLKHHATLTVVDTGPGIPEAELARAGERFFRGSNVNLPGTGLGLAIVKSIAERHGGELLLSTGSGGIGLCATMTLPLCDALGASTAI
jgi:two-component system, OmpR family, sensor histidine kinase TctE